MALGAVVAWLGCCRRGGELSDSADAVAPGRVPAQAIGRWGNRFNQELYGRRSVTRVDTPCGTVRGHTGGLPGYSSEIYTDATGTRSVAVFTITNFGIKERKAATANKALVDAATC
ncbi:prolipoprotein diacylglyceryl transferase family protein [Streptomyces sp. NPDC051051]|uniref:prolipoprotein diacylglyceryl transferase family protein n=1 Tax=Streptomyces sp. NPDC051051 TaxID=3155666 RepID=UPI0034347D79